MQELAEVYARSLFESAQEHDRIDAVHEQLGQVCDELASSRDLQVFFFSPYFSSQEQADGISKVLEDADEYLVRFLELLCERHRMPVIHRVRRTFDKLWTEKENLLPVSITSAVELDEQTAEGVGRAIGEQTGMRVELSSSVDPEILGGLVIQVGNMVLDKSVRSRLERARKQVARAA